MVATRIVLDSNQGFYIPKMMSHGYGEYEHQSSSSITHNLTHLKCKKDILVRGDVHEDVSDIVEKFIKVAHGPDALENNRARENARENIRKKLAMEAGKEKMDSCDLQICFVNEFASDDEVSETNEDLPVLAKEDIVKSNISKRVSQIIVPLAALNHEEDQITEEIQSSSFQSQVVKLQSQAKEDLVHAREHSKIKIQDMINLRKKLLNKNLFNLLGLPHGTKLNRRMVSKFNVAQLQLIQNDYLAQIKSLNEELVTLLVKKDDLTMEQDALMTDIEDLSEFVNLKQQ